MSLKNPVTPPGIDPGTVQLVAQCLNHYVIPDPLNIKELHNFEMELCKYNTKYFICVGNFLEFFSCITDITN